MGEYTIKVLNLYRTIGNVDDESGPTEMIALTDLRALFMEMQLKVNDIIEREREDNNGVARPLAEYEDEDGDGDGPR